MNFHTPDSVYVAYFGGKAIVLNTATDEYRILPDRLSGHLRIALTRCFRETDGGYQSIDAGLPVLPDDFGESIEILVGEGVLLPCLHVEPSERPFRSELVPGGASNVDWLLSSADLSENVSFRIIAEAWLTLTCVHILTRISGIKGLVGALRRGRSECKSVDPKRFGVLVSAVNRAGFLFPVRVKCLEWSAALAIMALRRGWRCNMQIGVENEPFAAHAWVNVDGNVIADSQELPRTLSVILSEPFPED